MTGDELRQEFLRFFEERGHKVIPSSSLVPEGDPTLLLTSAGMVQFKPYFLGEAVPPSPRLVSCQKCFRTTDIESVGDSKHLTFFEMLGNFSIGDYFKREAIAWAWEFVTQNLKLPKERLWATIFLDDDESFGYWREVGVPRERIIRFGEEDNFWGPAGDTGPCGPCSEIHYDLGEEFGCGQPGCGPGCKCGRFVEIWNLVFTQYNQDRDGNRSPLPKPNIDTGMGLERTLAAVQGKGSVYETDLFAPLIRRVCELSRWNYGEDEETDRRIRVVSEHGRAITFLIADGVLPSNEGRGYVLRRVLRRAVLFGRRLGVEGSFLGEIARVVIENMKHVYPELVSSQDFIFRVIELEEERFSQTLDTGLNLLDAIIEKVRRRGGSVLPGEEVFRLYDTYGFPSELTAEIAAENGLSVDLEGFEVEMNRQRERARAAHKVDVSDGLVLKDKVSIAVIPRGTDFVGDRTLKHQSTIVVLLPESKWPEKSIDSVSQGQDVGVILRETPFYGEMGGQVGDTGEIRARSGRISVINTVRNTVGGSELIVHQGKVVEGTISVGDEVEAIVDKARRLDIARNHTATHLLQAALRQVLGGHVQQRGSLVAPDRLRFDFAHLSAVTGEELLEVQRLVNEKIRQDLKVSDRKVPYAQAVAEGALALFGERYGEEVRVIQIGEPPFSLELCGGTHVRSTGEIGYFRIIGESSIGVGVRRIEAVTGRGAEDFIEGRLSSLEKVARLVQSSPDEVEGKVAALLADLGREQKRALSLELELSKRIAESLVSKVETVEGIPVLAARVSASSMGMLRQIGDLLKERLGSAVIVLGAVWGDKPNFVAMVTPDLVARGLNAGQIVKQVAWVTGGGGGGRPGLGQAGGKDKEKLEEAIGLARRLIGQFAEKG